jgi:hypothetical protein
MTQKWIICVFDNSSVDRSRRLLFLYIDFYLYFHYFDLHLLFTKVIMQIIFNKCGYFIKEDFKIGGDNIECVNKCKYLGIIMSS